MRMASFASNSLPSGLALPLAAVFVVAMGDGMVLPVLPFLLMRFWVRRRTKRSLGTLACSPAYTCCFYSRRFAAADRTVSAGAQ